MSAVRPVLRAALTRAVVLGGAALAFIVILDLTGASEDVRAGIALFLGSIVLAFAGGLADGVRRGATPAALVWLLASLGAAVVVAGAAIGYDGGEDSAGDLVRIAADVAALTGVPSLLGAALGGPVGCLARRTRPRV